MHLIMRPRTLSIMVLHDKDSVTTLSMAESRDAFKCFHCPQSMIFSLSLGHHLLPRKCFVFLYHSQQRWA